MKMARAWIRRLCLVLLLVVVEFVIAKEEGDVRREERAERIVRKEGALASSAEKEGEALARKEQKEEGRVGTEVRRLEKEIEWDDGPEKVPGNTLSRKAQRVEEHLLKEAEKDEKEVKVEEQKAERETSVDKIPVRDPSSATQASLEPAMASPRISRKGIMHQDKAEEREIESDLRVSEQAASKLHRDNIEMRMDDERARGDDR